MNDDPIPTFNPKQAELAFDSARRDAAISAFPWVAEIYDYGFVISSGLTKRELFAALAMQGLASVPAEGGLKPSYIAADAANAVTYADALLHELAKDSP